MTAPSVIFEMLRSFVALARTLNVSQTAEELDLSRQTVKRHIQTLEEIKGKQLFEMENRQYRLTDNGESEYASATALLGRLDLWLDENSATINGLPRTYHEVNGAPYWAQRHPANRVWEMAPHLICRGLEAWTDGCSLIEHKKLRKVRPYLMVFRKNGLDWICVEVGEKSSYSSWLGWTWAKSAIGSSFFDDPTSSKTDSFLVEAYESVTRNGSVWYDHISTQIPRRESEGLFPANYQRLVMSMLFPDGSSAVGVLVARTNRIEIDGLNPDDIQLMPEEDLMEFVL